MTVFVDHVAAPWVLLLTYQPLQFAPLSCLIATWLRIAIFETIVRETVSSSESSGAAEQNFAQTAISSRSIITFIRALGSDW